MYKYGQQLIRNQLVAEADLYGQIAEEAWNDEIACRSKQMSAECRAAADKIDVELKASEGANE